MRSLLPAIVVAPLFAAVGCSRAVPVEEVSAAGAPASAVEAVEFSVEDWPSWRGPNRNNVAADGQEVPLSWSETENVLWKAPVPGRGHSSPAVIAGRVILTTADDEQQVQSVLAFDRDTGELLWTTDVHHGGFPAQIHAKNTHASPTVASDGTRLFAAFYNSDAIHVTALDLDGEVLWQQEAGPCKPNRFKHGYGASPAVHESLVIVATDTDTGGYIAGLDRATGRIVWRKSRPNKISYSSPIVASIAGRDQLLLSGCDIIAGYDPLTGDELWSGRATTAATCGTIVWDGDLVFASGGYPNAETAAVRADGSGEVVWRNTQKCYEQSLLAYDGHVYAVTDNGVAFCWDAEDGTERWRHRLSGPISASPVLADGVIFATNERGTTYAFRADPERFDLLAENTLGDEAFATPTICGGRIYVRAAHQGSAGREETLYCIGGAPDEIGSADGEKAL